MIYSPNSVQDPTAKRDDDPIDSRQPSAARGGAVRAILGRSSNPRALFPGGFHPRLALSVRERLRLSFLLIPLIPDSPSISGAEARFVIAANAARPVENGVAFCDERGACEPWIKETKGAIRWTRPSCRSFAANAVCLPLHALAVNLGEFPRPPAALEPIEDWSPAGARKSRSRSARRSRPRAPCRVSGAAGRHGRKSVRRRKALRCLAFHRESPEARVSTISE